MSTRMEMAKLVIEKIQEDQAVLRPLMQKELTENMDMPDGIQIFWVLNVALSNPENVKWEILMRNMESLIRDSSESDLHQLVYQNVLETFSNSITNGVFEHTWITPHIGPLSRKYIEDYDKFMQSKTPGF